ncbi:MAG: alpha/beta hydrolase [Chromatiales bacterium]|nr:alpha/beta hydrolase [Chromatiales bacterium]
MSTPLNCVLLQGLSREQRHWEDFPDRLARAIPGLRPILVDLPGNGALFQRTSPDTVEDLVEAVREEVRALKCDPPYLVLGLSLGGMLAWDWMLAYPQEISGIVVMNTSLGGECSLTKRMFPKSFLRLAAAFMRRDALARERAIVHWMSNRRDDTQVLAARWAEYARQCPVSSANVLRQLRAAARFHPGEEQPTRPVLVLSSSADRVTSPDCSLAVAQHHGLLMHSHPKAGHDLPLDAPVWVIEQLARWLV